MSHPSWCRLCAVPLYQKPGSGNCGLDGLAAGLLASHRQGAALEAIRFVYEVLFGPGLVTAPVYLALAALVAWIVWRRRGAGQGFWRWLAPARIWAHPSHLIDLQLFVLGRILAVLGVFSGVALTTLVAAGVAGLVPALLPAESIGPVALAFLLWLPSDFALYWMHRFYHRWNVIWPLHAVHHSAEVMTPFTTYRQHPLSLLLTGWGVAGFVGLCQGLLLGAAA